MHRTCCAHQRQLTWASGAVTMIIMGRLECCAHKQCGTTLHRLCRQGNLPSTGDAKSQNICKPALLH